MPDPFDSMTEAEARATVTIARVLVWGALVALLLCVGAAIFVGALVAFR